MGHNDTGIFQRSAKGVDFFLLFLQATSLSSSLTATELAESKTLPEQRRP